MKCEYKPGTFDRRVKLQSVARVSDGQGGSTESWSDVASVWASIEPVKGYERMWAMQMQTQVTHKVSMRYRSGVTTAHRLLYGSRVLAIKEAINVDERSIYLKLLCLETT